MNQQIAEEAYWLALAHVPEIGTLDYIKLITHFGNAQRVFEADWHEWQQLGLNRIKIHQLRNPNWRAVEVDQQWLAEAKHHLLTWLHPQYPTWLRQIYAPPPLLFVQGNCNLLNSQQLAIVGTRRASREGKQTAYAFAKYLTYQGLTITSGLALGIDGASHWGALAGTGKTIAVTAWGLNQIYPAAHRELIHQITEHGALISEFPPGTPVKREHFEQRGRIISGLSLGVLVVEAPERSSALHTVQRAMEQNREIFAIPGSIHNPLTRGCHLLIKQGAKLVETATDILEELRIVSSS